jgi:hypothetical protein
MMFIKALDGSEPLVQDLGFLTGHATCNDLCGNWIGGPHSSPAGKERRETERDIKESACLGPVTLSHCVMVSIFIQGNVSDLYNKSLPFPLPKAIYIALKFDSRLGKQNNGSMAL